MTFALEPRVGKGGEDEDGLPPGQGASLKMIELIPLLDRPALMGESPLGTRRRRGRQMDEIV